MQVHNDPSMAMGQQHYDSSLHDIASRLEGSGITLQSLPGMPLPSTPVPVQQLPITLQRELYDTQQQAAIVNGSLGEASLNFDQRAAYDQILAARTADPSQVPLPCPTPLPC